MMDEFTLADLTPVLLLGTIVLLVSVAAVRLSTRSGLPSLLLYLAIGLVLGDAGLGIRFDSAQLTQVLGYVALILILSEGGLTTRWSSIRRSVAPAAVLSTVGVAVSIATVAAAAHVVLGLDWQLALLLGAILSSTDAAAVFSVLRRVPLPRRLSGMLEAESGFNDAPVVLMVTAFATQIATGHAEPWWMLLLITALELAGGAAVGLAIGFGVGWVARRVAAGSSALFALGISATTILAYAVAASVHTSGFLACYLAALVLGNVNLPHAQAATGLATALGWLAQIGLFIMLGLLASPAGFPAQIGPALVLGAVLLLLARPLSVVVSLLPFRMGWRDQAFLSWAGLRGAVPVVLATVPMTTGHSSMRWIFDLVFVLVVVFTAVQAPTLPYVARLLGLEEKHHTLGLNVDTTPLDELHADLLQVTVGPDSRIGGVRVVELRLPHGANVALVVRDGAATVPQPNTVLRHGDDLLIVTTSQARDAAEKRVRAVSLGGRLAGWRSAPTPRRFASELPPGIPPEPMSAPPAPAPDLDS
ncbi:MAG: potassium/proton antiporter [Nostocoides sp.]